MKNEKTCSGAQWQLCEEKKTDSKYLYKRVFIIGLDGRLCFQHFFDTPSAARRFIDAVFNCPYDNLHCDCLRHDFDIVPFEARV